MARGSLFDRFARRIARFAGHPRAFAAAVAVIALWLVSGPLFGHSDTRQLAVSTATTIVTFLMFSSSRTRRTGTGRRGRSSWTS